MKAYINPFKISNILFLVFVFSGCESYLKENNPSEVTTDFLYTTADGLQAAVNGLYTIERAQFDDSESSPTVLIYGDGGTDLDFNRAADATVTRYDLVTNLATRSTISGWWQKFYRIIERSNSIITFGEQADIDADDKKAILRNAYIYRAYAYFWLVRKYDNIWLNTEPTTYENISGRTFTPAAQADVYEQIIADLDKALEYYGTDWTVVQGQFNQGVARLLRAEVALWQKDYQTAAAQATKIISEGPFALEATENVWAKDRRRNTKEGMYVIQWDEFSPGGGGDHRFARAFTAQYRSVPGCISSPEFGGYGWARLHPNPYFLSLFDKKYDKRYNAWFQHFYLYNDPTYDFSKLSYKFGDTLRVNQNSWTKGDNMYRSMNVGTKKYWDWEKEPLASESYNNIYIYRYPLVLFIAAEAYMHLEPDNVKALSYINQIRQNRILSTSPNQLLTTLNEDILLEEYARELGLEGHRWFLLKRMGKLVERVQKYGGVSEFLGVKATSTYYQCRTNIKPYHVRWPIPQSELDAMGSSFPQNEGYLQ